MQKVKLKYVNNDNQKIGLSNTMVATILTPQSRITGPPSLIKFDKEGIAYAVLKNCSTYLIWIERNDQHMGKSWLSTDLDNTFLGLYYLENIKSIQSKCLI